jgi:hypothetical protein
MAAVTAYEVSEWSDLFVAAAGAAAALAGLVFVAVSINVERILSLSGLPERALATVLLLVSVVLVSLIGLIPGQTSTATGVELLAEGLVLGVTIAALSRPALPSREEPHAWLAGRLTLIASGTVPFVIGGISLMAGSGGGLYWTVAGILFAIGGGVANAWVLLIEILR